MYAHDKLLDNDEFMFCAITWNYNMLIYLSNRLKNDELFIDRIINKLIETIPDIVDNILNICSTTIFNLEKYKCYKNYDNIGFRRLFQGKTELHKNVPLNIKFKNKFRRVLKEKHFRYNHYLKRRDETTTYYSY
jgi:hypothetical protein